MTYPDRTVYPVASPNLRDFYNLVDVYLDAVFHPRLVPAVFQQEGWIHEVVEAQRDSGAAPTSAPPAALKCVPRLHVPCPLPPAPLPPAPLPPAPCPLPPAPCSPLSSHPFPLM